MPLRQFNSASLFICIALVFSSVSLAQTPPAPDSATTAIWNAVDQAPFDAGKTAQVKNLTLVRDRIRITLIDGTIQFSQPAAGVVFGAAFKGEGRIEVSPPNAGELQQLEFFTKQRSLVAGFTDATFSFTDGTFDEIAKQVQWTTSSDNSLANLYQTRQRFREDLAQQAEPRIFEGVLSSDHAKTAYFAADVKTTTAGWVFAQYDALQMEQVSVGRYAARGTPVLQFDTWMSFPAGGVTAIEADQNPLAKDVFLAKRYDIDATVTAGADFSATTKVGLRFQVTGERVAIFQLTANLRVSSVKDDHGTALTFFQPKDPKDRFPSYGDYVAVVLPQATTEGQESTLTFDYAGKRMVRKVGTGNYFCPSYGWYPGATDEFATRADFEMTFHSPKKYLLVATGDKAGESTDGNSIVTKWKSPAPQAVAGFAFGDYKLSDTKVGDTSVEIYGNKTPDDMVSAIEQITSPSLPGQTGVGMPAMGNLDPSSMLKTTSIEIGNNLRVFENYFGPFPFSRLAVTNIPYSYGQGWPMLLYLDVVSFMDETQRHELGVVDQIRISDFFRAHEVSHQWWGHEVGWKTYHDQWLSEGFAQFSGNLYVQFRDGEKKYLDRLHADREELLEHNSFGHRYNDIGALWMGQRLASSPVPEGYNVVVYNKGGYVLEMLRAMLQNPHSKTPDDDFKAMMQDFTKTFNGKAASTEDFKAVVERHMNQAMNVDQNHKMDWFFNEYVYGTGAAEYRIDYSFQSQPNNQWLLMGTVTQSGVPDGWKDVLPIYLHMNGKAGRVGWIRVEGKSTPFKIPLGFKPDKVSLNDNAEILADVK